MTKRIQSGAVLGILIKLPDCTVLVKLRHWLYFVHFSFNGSRAVLSGPAGGVVGYAKTSYSNRPVIGFDMGGTSTDVSRYDGTYEHVFESVTAGITIQAPQVNCCQMLAISKVSAYYKSV